MGVTIGMPCLKLNNAGRTSKHCGDFKKVADEALAERRGRDQDIDHSRTKDNVVFGYRTAAELIDYSDRHVQELTEKLRANGERGIRCDAVTMCAIIIKPPALWIKSLSRKKQLQFFNDSLEKIKDIVGEKNVKSIAIHFDELSPHMHVFWEPMTPDGRLCAKDMHGLRFLGNLNREMPKYLRSKGWEIDDCNAYDVAEEQKKKATLGKEKYQKYLQDKRAKNGQDSFKFKAKMESEKEELIRNYSVKKDKVIKGAFGKNKIVEKTDEELKTEQTILAAKELIKCKDQIKSLKAYYQKLKDDEEQLINEKAEELSKQLLTRRELEAIRSERRIKEKIAQIEMLLIHKFGVTINDLINEKQDDKDTKDITINDRKENYYEYKNG